MKKYVKPDFYFENFQLSNYAAGCTPVNASVRTSNDPNNCIYYITANLGYFNQGTACIEYGNLPEGYCYQNGSGMTVAWS